MAGTDHLNARVITELEIEQTPPGQIGEYWMHIINDGIGEPVRLPILVARGVEDGPVLGLTAAIHGNELNGIPVIQKLFRDIDVRRLRGTVVGVLVLNVPGLLLEQRKFNDGTDLNRIAPGRPDGDVSQVYINRIINRILHRFDYLVDLHTASFGRVNSWYIRADMTREITSVMARLQNPEIILNNPGNDGTFRGTAAHLGINAITLELKDPHVFQFDVINDALVGVWNIIFYLDMMDGQLNCPLEYTTLCENSYWLYTDEGGILQVLPQVRDFVRKGDPIAEIRTIFGKRVKRYYAPDDGIVIGRSVDPINQTGSRILHLGLRPRRIPCRP